ncbi:MAG: ATPase, T2SS/T4P/T4SS family, partial [Thermoanaerobaculia bacterium]
MAETDLDLLIGRLAVHYQVLSKEQAQGALLAWQQGGRRGDFGTFLSSEGLIAPEVLQKLLRARAHYLQRADDGSPAPASSLDDTKPTAEARSVGDRTDPSTPALQGAEPPELELGEPPELELDDPSPAAAVRAPAGAPESAGPSPAVPQSAPVPVAAPAAAPSAPVPQAGPPEAAPVAAPQPAPAPAATPPEPQNSEALLRLGPDTRLEDLLRQTRELGASDLHLHCGARIKLRLDGRLLDAAELLERERAEGLIRGLLDEEQLARVEAESQIDFAYTISGVGRFRVNVYRQQRGLDAVFRAIAPTAPTLEELGLPAAFERFASFHQGIVLFTGPAGCGKSSTMAAMVRLISENRSDHIITIEDPIEYVHPSLRSIVNQRQVGGDTKSFARALRAALREDPDVIVIGELRDLETISLALTAAETGHLVFGTLHTSN